MLNYVLQYCYLLRLTAVQNAINNIIIFFLKIKLQKKKKILIHKINVQLLKKKN